MSRRGAKEGSGSAYLSYQQKRRAVALERQREARQDRVQHVRNLASAALEAASSGPQDDAMQDVVPGAPPSQRRHSGRHHAQRQQQLPEQAQLYGLDGIDPGSLSGATLRAYFARQLQQPEWLTDIPPDLGSSWLVMPRPEGKRCLVISNAGSTIIRSRTGALLARCATCLPGGGLSSAGGPTCFCVLDCILQEDQQTQQQNQQQQHEGAAGSSSMDADQPMAAQADGAEGGEAAGDGPSGLLFIQDVLAWRGYGLTECGADFRLFWLASKLQEEEPGLLAPGGSTASSSSAGVAASPAAAGGPVQMQQQQQPPQPPQQQQPRFRFQLLPFWPATSDGLAAAVGAGAASLQHASAGGAPGGAGGSSSSGSGSGSLPAFIQDGVYLLHCQGHYAIGGLSTPLALLWKDASCSRYLLDTDGAGVVPQHQQLVLAYQGPPGCGVATADEPPVVLGRLPQQSVAQMCSKLRAGRLLRFSIREGGLLLNPDGSPGGADLAYEGPANQRRGRADLISKIMFQWQVRRQPLSLQMLQNAARTSQAAAGCNVQQCCSELGGGSMAAMAEDAGV